MKEKEFHPGISHLEQAKRENAENKEINNEEINIEDAEWRTIIDLENSVEATERRVADYKEKGAVLNIRNI